MKLHCPHCGVKGSAEDSYSGRKVKCPKCQGVFTVESDMVLGLSEDATSVSTAPAEASLSASEVDTMDTINHTEDRPEEPGTDKAVSVVAADEQIEIAGDLTEPEAATSPGEEEKLDWEDVASEIDLQLNEAEEEETIELEEPVDSFDLSEENDDQTGDEVSEAKVIETSENPGQTTTEEIAETTDTAEIAESAESVEEKDEDAPAAVPLVEEETVAASQEQSRDAAVSAIDESGQTSDKFSLGEVIRKTWAKIKNALSS